MVTSFDKGEFGGLTAVRLVVGLSVFLTQWFAAPLGAQSLPVLDQYRVPVTRLRGVPLGNPDDFARPTDIEFVSGRLVVIDRRSEMMIHVIDAKSGRTLRKFGKKGSGPGEYRGPWAVVPERNSAAFWIFDTSLRRMTRVDVDQDFRRGYYLPGRSFQLAGGVELNSPRWTADGTLLASGHVRDGLLAAFDARGQPLASRGDFRFGDPRLPIYIRQQAYPSTIDTDDSGTRLVLATRYSDRLEFHETSGRRIGGAERPFGFEPQFVVTGRDDERNVASLPDSRNGYVAVRATDARVYALFSGKRFGDSEGRASFAQYVHVFAWTGKLLAVLMLDMEVLDIAVDSDERLLYAIRNDPLPQVMVYTLPASLSQMR